MQDGAAPLDTAVMASADNLGVMHQHGADRDTAFAESLSGFFDGGFQKGGSRVLRLSLVAETAMGKVWGKEAGRFRRLITLKIIP